MIDHAYSSEAPRVRDIVVSDISEANKTEHFEFLETKKLVQLQAGIWSAMFRHCKALISNCKDKDERRALGEKKAIIKRQKKYWKAIYEWYETHLYQQHSKWAEAETRKVKFYFDGVNALIQTLFFVIKNAEERLVLPSEGDDAEALKARIENARRGIQVMTEAKHEHEPKIFEHNKALKEKGPPLDKEEDIMPLLVTRKEDGTDVEGRERVFKSGLKHGYLFR